MLLLYTVVGIGAVLGFARIEQGMVWAGFLLAVIANLAFEGGIVFYNAYLPDIAPPSHHGRVSARGFAVGYFGSLIALAVAAPLAGWGLMDFVWIALGLQWTLAAVPAFLFLPRDARTGMTVPRAAVAGFRKTVATWKSVLGMPNLRRFLLAYFFYMDGVNTVIWFAGVYASATLKFAKAELIYMFGLVQIAALVGSILMGGPTDRKGPRWTVRRVLLWWILVVVAVYFTTSKMVFWGVAACAGLGIGSIQASSRALMSRLIPDGREAELFGFYALCGKTGAILGPLVFGAITATLGGQRPAVLSVAAFYIVGFVLLGRVRTDA
jgi:UMF1 family MFS transporter